MSNNLIAAIDIGSLTNSVAFMNAANGHIIAEHKKLPNNLPGINRLWEDATRLLKEYGLDHIDFVMESSGPYWFGPYWWLKDRCSTLNPSATLTALNPQIVAGFKGKFSHKKQRTNQKDAKTIANRFRFGHLDPVYAPQGDILTLRYYTRYRLHGIQTIVAAKAFFLSYLSLKMSEYRRYCKKKEERLFADIFGATSSILITRYNTAEELARAPIEELTSIMNDTGNGMIPDTYAKASIAKDMARNSYAIPEEAVEPVNFILSESLSHIRFLEGLVKNVDKRIEPLLSRIDDPIKSIPGIGPVFAAGIIAETGDIKRFKGHPQLASYFGILPSMDDSGEYQSSLNHMTKTGNSYGRYYFIEAANSLRMRNPVFRSYFQKKLAETSPRKFKRALGHTARKLIRVYYAMKTKNQAFDPPLLAA